MPFRGSLICLCAVTAPALAAANDWTYFILHAEPYGSSGAQATHGAGVTAGYFGSEDESDHHAALWTGLSADTLIDLHPAGFAASRINGTSGAQHVGHTVRNGDQRAALWTGSSAETFISLHPAGMKISYALGIDGERQVGFAENAQGVARAYMWSGSAGSAVSLHPPGAGHSYAYDIGGGRQVGFVEDVAASSGGYWEGTADSWTPLLSVGDDFGGTFTNCISPDGRQQGGYAVSRLTGVNWAAIWEGSTDTFRSLHPDPGLIGSTLLDTDGAHQVGYIINFGQFAAIWSGTAESYFDLHSLLPDEYRNSHAFDVYEDQDGLWVAGRAAHATTGRWEAVAWHLPIPAPAILPAFGAGVLIRRARRRA